MVPNFPLADQKQNEMEECGLETEGLELGKKTTTNNNLIMSLSSLIFQANDYHMQTHLLCKTEARSKDRGRDSAILHCKASLAALHDKIHPPPPPHHHLSVAE